MLRLIEQIRSLVRSPSHRSDLSPNPVTSEEPTLQQQIGLDFLDLMRKRVDFSTDNRPSLTELNLLLQDNLLDPQTIGEGLLRLSVNTNLYIQPRMTTGEKGSWLVYLQKGRYCLNAATNTWEINQAAPVDLPPRS